MDYNLEQIEAWLEPTLEQDPRTNPSVTLPLEIAQDMQRVVERFKAFEQEVDFLRRKSRREDRLTIDRYKQALTRVNTTMTSDVNRLKEIARNALQHNE